MNFIKQNWFKLSIVLGILILSSGIFYHYWIYIPKQKDLELKMKLEERAKEARKEQEMAGQREAEKVEQEKSLDACLKESLASFYESWAYQCKDLSEGVIKLCSNSVSKGLFSSVEQCALETGNIDISGSANCRLPQARADGVKANSKELLDQCYRLYGKN